MRKYRFPEIGGVYLYIEQVVCFSTDRLLLILSYKEPEDVIVKRTLSLCLSLLMALTLLAGCQKQQTAETPKEPSATEAPAQATAEPAPTEEPIKGAYEGDDYGTGAVGEFGATACADPIAAQIGVDILKAGGNAVDAAVAMIYAVGLLEPAASGIGGAGQMLIYLKEQDRYLVLEYMTQAPGAAVAGEISTDTSSNPPSPESIAIPGVVHGTMTALEKYGTMTPAQVLQPVIDLARNGFTLPERWNTNLEGRYANLSAYPYTMGIYTDDGFFYSHGQTIYNKDLADTLELIANGGKEAFYNSDFTQKMVDYIQSIGGLLTREDFAQYETKEREAISTTYRGKKVYTVGGPSNGGTALLEMLNIMENFDMAALGHDSMEAVKVTADAYAMACMDGVAFMADPDYYNLPTEEMISKEYAAERASKIDLTTYLKNAKKGNLTVTLSETGEKVDADTTPDQGGTTHLSVMDSYGNVVSTTNTNGINFGSAVAVPGTGFVFSAHLGNLNNSATAKVNKLMPYIRVRTTICPSIVADENGVPFMAVGSPGNWALVSAVAITISNVIDYDMNVAQAINAPRIYRDKNSKQLSIESRYGEEVLQKLTDLGFEISDEGELGAHVGCVAAIYHGADGKFYAGADYRRLYGAAAY